MLEDFMGITRNYYEVQPPCFSIVIAFIVYFDWILDLFRH